MFHMAETIQFQGLKWFKDLLFLVTYSMPSEQPKYVKIRLVPCFPFFFFIFSTVAYGDAEDKRVLLCCLFYTYNVVP